MSTQSKLKSKADGEGIRLSVGTSIKSAVEPGSGGGSDSVTSSTFHCEGSGEVVRAAYTLPVWIYQAVPINPHITWNILQLSLFIEGTFYQHKITSEILLTPKVGSIC